MARLPPRNSGRPSSEGSVVVDARDPSSGRYEQLEVVGSGGMGQVWLCRDRVLGRGVALKALSPERARFAGNRARFLREAMVQGQLEHPNIPPVYDVDPGSASPRFTMRYVRGRTLGDVIEGLRRGKPEFTQRFSRRGLLVAFSAVCSAVHHAHTRGVVHRDLKPENVMLGDHGEVYVLDWGVARLVGAGGEEVRAWGDSAAVTEAGVLLGTPGFAAPEQWVDSSRADARSDVFSLGAMLFELLTWEPLFDGLSARELLAQTFDPYRLRASACAPEHGIAPALDALCARATALDPAARFQSVAEMRDALERYLDGDRESQQRSDAARDLAAEAERLARAGLSAHREDTLAKAVQTASRAVAFDPANLEAQRTLVRALLAPPHETPHEVREALREDWQRRVQSTARVGVRTFSSWVLLAPMLYVLGVRDLRALGVVSATMLLAAGVSAWQASRPRLGEHAALALLAARTAAIASLSLLGGALMVVPAALLASAVVYVAHGNAPRRRSALAVAVTLALLPLALEVTGLAPPSLVFEHGRAVLAPFHGQVSRVGTLAAVAVAMVFLFVNAVTALHASRESNRLEVERLHVLMWQLRRLMPEGARDAVTTTSPR